MILKDTNRTQQKPNVYCTFISISKIISRVLGEVLDQIWFFKVFNA